jgi:hypothetical protein
MAESFVDLSLAAQKALLAGARDKLPVRGLTHNFYRYPARFSPAFARAAIETFTRPGDFVLDPHVGGGTTIVEAFALGRSAVGVDISPLAEFVRRSGSSSAKVSKPLSNLTRARSKSCLTLNRKRDVSSLMIKRRCSTSSICLKSTV